MPNAICQKPYSLFLLSFSKTKNKNSHNSKIQFIDDAARPVPDQADAQEGKRNDPAAIRVGNQRGGGSRNRAWICTLNNPGANFTFEEFTRSVLLPIGEALRGFAGQLEKGERGTTHLQAGFWFHHPRSLGGMRRVLARAHWEPMRGTPKQLLAYVTKEETREQGPWFYPDNPESWLPQPGKRTDIDRALEAIKRGADDRQLLEVAPGPAVKFHRGLQHARKVLFPHHRPRQRITVALLWGEPGTGKSSAVFAPHDENALGTDQTYAQSLGRWFDGYDRHPILILDDLDTSCWTRSDLLKLLDRWPYLVGTKGGTVPAQWTFVLITHNLHPKEWLLRGENPAFTTEAQHAALLRRFNFIFHFGRDRHQEVLITSEKGAWDDFLRDYNQALRDAEERAKEALHNLEDNEPPEPRDQPADEQDDQP